ISLLKSKVLGRLFPAASSDSFDAAFASRWGPNNSLYAGDAQYKPYVTARPEIAVVELDGDEDFVVVACDGLWDVLSEDAVALSVYKQIINDPDKLKAAFPDVSTCKGYYTLHFVNLQETSGYIDSICRRYAYGSA
ncbi:jg14690, partial [Pararge aegeria aegeria]